MFALIFECGSTTVSWYAEFALRRRVRKSAIGSVIVMVTCQPFSPWFPSRGACGEVGWAPARSRGRQRPSPARFAHARELSRVRHLPDADSAQPELAEHRTRATATLTAGVGAHLVLGLAGSFGDQSFPGHLITPP